MLKNFLRYVVEELSTPYVDTVNGETYSDRPLHRIDHNPKASPICMNTLSSLIDYIRSHVDQWNAQMIIHVQSPTRVQMYSALDYDRKRETLVEVNAQVPAFDFNRFIDHETFCINLQSKFINNPETDRALLLKFAGTVEAGSVAEYGDDGITQKATVKTGIASKENAIVPSPATLQAYRTFVEVEQPRSCFVFRMNQEKYGGIQCALFEADGGAWKIEAMDNIRTFLEENLKDIENLVIIS